MPKCEVAGMSKRFTGTSKKTGKGYDFYKLHLLYTDRGVDGTACMVETVDTGMIPPGLAPGQSIYLEFDSSGRVDSVRLFPEGK